MRWQISPPLPSSQALRGQEHWSAVERTPRPNSLFTGNVDPSGEKQKQNTTPNPNYKTHHVIYKTNRNTKSFPKLPSQHRSL